MFAGFGVMRVGLVLVLEAFVDLAVNGLLLLGDVAEAAYRLFAHNPCLVEFQRVVVVHFGVQLGRSIVAFHKGPFTKV
jgi:hypothetical protein